MTPARPASYGLGTPPPLQLWLHAVLMLFAELVSHAASTLQMVLVRRTRECHTKASHEDLPRATSGNPFKETDQAEPTGLSTGSGLLAAFPAKAGIQTPREARTNNSSALRALTSPPPSRGTRVDRCAPRSLLSFRAKAQRAADLGERRRLGAIWSGGPNRGANAGTPGATRAPSPRSCRRTSASRADGKSCPNLQLQSGTRVKTVPGFRRSSE